VVLYDVIGPKDGDGSDDLRMRSGATENLGGSRICGDLHGRTALQLGV
jgi:hypothetical protein